MIVFRKVTDIKKWLIYQKDIGKTIGFVPTMGALHAGHISLINASRSENDITVCSIFVNPTQFNDPKDLEKYPRTLEADSTLLIEAKCEVLFYPPVEEIYPKEGLPEINVNLNGLDSLMEGIHRPGHFKGVVQVVHRLLDIVQPHHLYMGQKDFQQFTIIEQMIIDLSLPVKLVVCPISREPHGLAMSSRNERLSKDGRLIAGEIYKELSKVHQLKTNHSPKEICAKIFNALSHDPFTPEYVDIVNSTTLVPVDNWITGQKNAICVAVWLEGVRLIDNIIFN